MLPSGRRTARLTYLSLLAGTIALGLASRRYADALPAAVATYAGDTLWAAAVYWGLGLVSEGRTAGRRAAMALAIAVAVELTQLYHAPWLDALRATRLGGWLLGFGFLWSDLACYAAGVGAAFALERLLAPSRRLARSPQAAQRAGTP